MRRKGRKFLGLKALTKTSRATKRRQTPRRPAPPRPPAAKKPAVSPNLARAVARTLRARHGRYATASQARVVASQRTAASWSAAARLLAAGRDKPQRVGARADSRPFVRRTEALLRNAEIEATRRVPRPSRPLRSSRRQLWRWYRANGWSWERFVADHGEPT